MTRVNCVPVEELCREHLIAEYKEISRISRAARPNPDAPKSYTMGKGHVIFFYDKGAWLKNRYENELVPEMLRRGYEVNYPEYREHPPGLNNDWEPTPEAIAISRARIAERLADMERKNGKQIQP